VYSPTRGSRLAAAVAVALLTLSACGAGGPPRGDGKGVQVADLNPDVLHGTLVDSAARPTRVLRDTTGRPYSLAERPDGQLTVLFFGYTHCPDLCPTTMADLAAARAQLPDDLRERVEVVFVTEDPERDTNRVLRTWLDRYDPSFVGLRGGSAASESLLDELYLPRTKPDPEPGKPIRHPGSDNRGHRDHGRYGIEHASVVYAFGPEDRTVIYTGGATPSEYAADFTMLLDTNTELR
jgi:protein SCO1/2